MRSSIRPAEVTRAAAVVVATFAAGAARAQAPPSDYRLWWSGTRNSEADIANLVTASRGALRGTTLLAELLTPEEQPGLGVLARSGLLVLVDLPIASYHIVIAHEIFGHGSRLLEVDATPSYQLDLPVPYSFDADHGTLRRDARALTDDEESLVKLGGLQAQERAQAQLAQTAFRTGVLRRGEAFLYAVTSLTQAAQMTSSADMAAHRARLGARYQLDESDVEAWVLGSLVPAALDPLTWFSVYAVTRYLALGDPATAYPALVLDPVRLSLTSRVMPVPWGVEHGLSLLLGAPGLNLELGARVSAGPGDESLAVQLSAFDVRVFGPLHANVEAVFWAQPRLRVVADYEQIRLAGLIPVPADVTEEGGLGGSLYGTLEARAGRWRFGARLGGKSAGLYLDKPFAAGAEVLWMAGSSL